jgi:hypothetical protein
MIPILIISCCAAVWVAMGLSTYCAYHLGKQHGWNEGSGKRTQYQKHIVNIRKNYAQTYRGQRSMLLG